MTRILDALVQSNGQASGKLHRETFGLGLERDRFERVVGALVRAGHVTEQEDAFEKDGRVIEYRRLFLTPRGRRGGDLESVPMVVEAAGPVKSTGRKPKPRASRRPDAAREVRVEADAAVAPDPGLVEALKGWRLDEARRQRVPAFCVMANRTLEAVARLRPSDDESLLRIHGVGYKFAERYGGAILALVRRHGSDA
jgi:DNA topoisomerase-3